MRERGNRSRRLPAMWAGVLSVTTVGVVGAGVGAAHAGAAGGLIPGDLLVSRSVYLDPGTIQPGVTQLPPGCSPGSCVTAVASGAYPQVFGNEAPDPSFGVTSPLYLDQITPGGTLVNSIEVPNSTQNGVPGPKDQMVTSFSSKSEGALNLSTSGDEVSFLGYLAPVGAIDVSNANTPAVVDPTDPVPGTNYRVMAILDEQGKFRFTETNAYSGNNGRAALVNDSDGENVAYLAGNAGNGGDPQPAGIIEGAGAQFLVPQNRALAGQHPGDPQPLGSFSITQLGDAADKVGKDTNFRGLTEFNNVLYFTKGSGGNGVNTVYFLDTTGTACPNGVGDPALGAPLPTAPIQFNSDPTFVQQNGVQPDKMCILKGFPTALKSKTSFPFGIWFANAHTAYVADEGNGTNTFSTTSGTYTKAASQATAGLQKWVEAADGTWSLAYTLQGGLNLGAPYTVPGYPTGTNPATNLPWSPATDGLRNITGTVNQDGAVTIYGITSTVSGGTDQGADPNKLVGITDSPSATSPAAGEAFTTLRAAGFGEVLRGVSFTPGTNSRG